MADKYHHRYLDDLPDGYKYNIRSWDTPKRRIIAHSPNYFELNMCF